MSDIPRQPAPEDVLADGQVEDEAADDVEALESDADGEAGDDGDAGGEDEGGQDEEVLADDPPPPRRGGGSQAVREQRRRAQEAERLVAEKEREIAELRGFRNGVTARQPADPNAQAKAEQEFYAQLELMPLPDAIRAATQRAQGQVGQYVGDLEFRLNDRADKAAYDAEARVNPIFKRFQPEVERVLAAERSAGRNPDREVILDVLYGREMRQRASRVAPAQRRAGAARVAAAQARPTGARSTAPAAPRRPAPGSIEADRAAIAAAIARGEKVF